MTVMGIIQAYGDRIMQLVILSAIVITVLGGIKATGIYNRFKNKDVRKLMLFLSCIVLDLVAVVIYIVQEKVGWDNYLPAAIGAVGITTVMYAFYENAFVRNLILLIFRSVKNGLVKMIAQQQTKDALKEAAAEAVLSVRSDETSAAVKESEAVDKPAGNATESAENDFKNTMSVLMKMNQE